MSMYSRFRRVPLISVHSYSLKSKLYQEKIRAQLVQMESEKWKAIQALPKRLRAEALVEDVTPPPTEQMFIPSDHPPLSPVQRAALEAAELAAQSQNEK